MTNSGRNPLVSLSMTFFEKLNRLCGERGVSQREVAKIADVSAGTAHNWQAGIGPGPRLAEALALARFFKVDLVWLADDAQDDPPPAEDDTLREVLSNVRRLGAEEVMRRIVDADRVYPNRPLGGGSTRPKPMPEPDPPSVNHPRGKHNRAEN